MKKLLAVLTAIGVGAATLSGCGQSQVGETQAQETKEESQSQEVSETASGESSEAEGEKAEESAQTAELDLDKLVFTYVTAPLNVPSIIEKNQGIFADAFGQYGLR